MFPYSLSGNDFKNERLWKWKTKNAYKEVLKHTMLHSNRYQPKINSWVFKYSNPTLIKTTSLIVVKMISNPFSNEESCIKNKNTMR